MSSNHPLWLPENVTAAFGGRTVAIVAPSSSAGSSADPAAWSLLDTVRDEVTASAATLVDDPSVAQIVIAPVSAAHALDGAPRDLDRDLHELGPESFVIVRDGRRTIALWGGPSGALYAWFQLLRDSATGHETRAAAVERHAPDHELRMLDHWDNIDVHPVMGQVERGYAGGSLFYEQGRLRDDLTRVHEYARLLASIGINRVSVNNVNVHEREARLLTADLDDVVRLAEIFRPWGIRLHLAVNFASPIQLGGLSTSDPLDDDVVAWWAVTTAAVYSAIPDFGGYLVKADSEGQPGPFAYDRTHAEGANLLARALAPHGGIVHWRAFVYNHHQDWRDRRTDRARAAYDHFSPHDGEFDDNVIVQVKYGPLDFQTREPVSPVISGMQHTRVALELQVTQEYTGHQLHAVYLAPQWHEILHFRPTGDDGPAVSQVVAGGIAAVANVGDDAFLTGHPLAQANLYAYGRLAWSAELDPAGILDEWIALTFGVKGSEHEAVRRGIHAILDESWLTYEMYTAPLGVCFMVNPMGHYGPSVDGYEYSAWGTYHFADRDGIGVDRTVATGTGFAGQYPAPWKGIYESLETVPDELILFFHHVPYTHALRTGSTVIQHIYDTHFAGVERVEAMVAEWAALEGLVPDDVFARVTDRLAEQLRSSIEWRDHINTYFWRKSGIADEAGRTIY